MARQKDSSTAHPHLENSASIESLESSATSEADNVNSSKGPDVIDTAVSTKNKSKKKNNNSTSNKNAKDSSKPTNNNKLTHDDDNNNNLGATTTQSFDVADYVYNAGFVHAAWSDTFLHLPPHPPLRLHALFLSRSPLLYRVLTSMSSASQGPPFHISLPLPDRNVTTASLSIVLAALYGRPLDLPTYDLVTLKGIIAAASFLGLDELASSAYQSLLNFVVPQNIQELLDFAFSNLPYSSGVVAPLDTAYVAAPSGPMSNGSGPVSASVSPSPSSHSHSHSHSHSYSHSHSHSSSTSTSASPSPSPYHPHHSRTLSHTNPNSASLPVQIPADVDPAYPGPYPATTAGLLTAVLNYILANLDASQPLDSKPNSEFTPTLQTLPFSLLKHICESDSLTVPSFMARHNFAKSVVASRDAYKRQHGFHGPSDETVVLAFSGGGQSVQIIRKSAGKKKSLWKASS